MPTARTTKTDAPARRARRQGPASEAAAEPRDRILKAAAGLFRRQGYRGTTVRDIADAVGILSGSLFHHFSSKEEMLLEIMREAFVSVCIDYERMVSQEPDPVRQLRELIRLELDAILNDERKDYHAVLYFDWREAPQSAMPELNRLRRRYRACWQRALQGCRDSGRLRCEPDIAQHVITGTMRGVMTWFRKGGKYSTGYFGDVLAGLFIEPVPHVDSANDFSTLFQPSTSKETL